MADEKFEAPPETPHFTSEDASDANADTPSVAPDEAEPVPDPEDTAPEGTDLSDDIAKTSIKGPHN